MAIERFRRTLVGIVMTSVAYGFLYFMVLSFGITLGEAELASGSPLLAVRDTLMFLATVLGFPFMRLFGSNSAAILGTDRPKLAALGSAVILRVQAGSSAS